MRIGVPKEIKNHEYRVALTPPSAAELVAAGHEVLVQTGAGSGIDFEDADYQAVGARIVGNAQDVDLPWIHWCFPRTIWHLGDNTVEEGILNPVVAGFSRSNGLWGHGPYGDTGLADVIGAQGSLVQTDQAPPDASCDYADIAVAS